MGGGRNRSHLRPREQRLGNTADGRCGRSSGRRQLHTNRIYGRSRFLFGWRTSTRTLFHKSFSSFVSSCAARANRIAAGEQREGEPHVEYALGCDSTGADSFHSRRRRLEVDAAIGGESSRVACF